MKNAASFAARILTAIAIAAVVAFAQYWIWQQLNRSTEFIGTNQSIKGFAYNGFQRDQSPLKGTYPTRAELASDLDLLGRYSDGLRTYGVNDLPELLDLAGERDMLVTAGAWIDARPDSNAREVAALIDAARKMRHIERVMVGNEAILRGDVTVGELIVYLDEVRKAIRKPVSTAEPWHVWLRYPELAKHVDYITVHLLPYHEGLPVDKAVEYAFQRYDEVARAHPRKKIVVGEVGWPSRGPTIDAAIPSLDNQARFVREFLAHPRTARIDYFLMEAIDQPWKVDVEGWAGPYWGMFNADREPKYQLEGVVERDPHWSHKASNAAALAFIPMMLAAFFLPGWSIGGRLFLAALIQACISTLIIGINVPVEYYLTQRDLIGLVLLIGATCMTAAVLLSHGFEFGEVLFKKKWARRFTPLPPHPPEQQPFVSIHLA
ncbi:MAG TPA: glycosyl hydrolase family 17 protein, partial [Thauera sp.]